MAASSGRFERKYGRETISLACHAVHRSRASQVKKKKSKRCYAYMCVRNREKETDRGGGEKLLGKRAREIPPTLHIFPPLPIIPSPSRRERNMKARAREVSI